ncbi:hypothetical protein ACIBF1_44210 [Spirillospora sp. NPDC050679]
MTDQRTSKGGTATSGGGSGSRGEGSDCRTAWDKKLKGCKR